MSGNVIDRQRRSRQSGIWRKVTWSRDAVTDLCTGVCLANSHDSSVLCYAKSLQSCPTLCDPIDSSHQAPRPWDSLGKNTGVGCHFLLQCMKVKSESEVAQSCPTLSDPMDCSPPGSSIRGIFQAKVLEWGAIAFSVTQRRGPFLKT